MRESGEEKIEFFRRVKKCMWSGEMLKEIGINECKTWEKNEENVWWENALWPKHKCRILPSIAFSFFFVVFRSQFLLYSCLRTCEREDKQCWIERRRGAFYPTRSSSRTNRFRHHERQFEFSLFRTKPALLRKLQLFLTHDFMDFFLFELKICYCVTRPRIFDNCE